MLVITNYAEALRPLGLGTMEGVKSFRGELIKNHKGRRDIQRLQIENEGRPLTLFLKRNRQPYKKDGLTSLFTRGTVGSLSRIEWENALALQRAGLAVAEPVAWGEECGPLWERFSFILTAAARGESTLDKFLNSKPDAGEQARVLDALARFVRKLHDAGFASPDLFTRHLFLTRGAEPQFCLIDMARLDRRPNISPALRARDLAALHVTTPLRHLPGSARRRFLRRYGGLDLHARILARAMHLLTRKKFQDFFRPHQVPRSAARQDDAILSTPE